MKRLFPIISTLMLMLTLALAGCGGGNSGGIPPTSGITLDMVPVSGGLSFPTDGDTMTMRYGEETADSGYGGKGSDSLHMTVPRAYDIAQTDVTYEQWSTIYTWATTKATNKYSFAHAGVGGSSGSSDLLQPVTTVSWSDAIVWCNALTEYYNANNGKNYACVYTYNGAIIRDSTNNTACSNVTAVSKAGGFRLPTNNEWELAARYIGTTAPTVSPLSTARVEWPSGSGFYWTPGSYASGATDDYSDSSATAEVAVNWPNSCTADVASKRPNQLGLYDMTGNVAQMCFDSYGTHRVMRGWAYNTFLDVTGLGCMFDCDLTSTYNYAGFRVVRTQ
ncbi:MAG TPA: hypothetical protein DDW65_09560 [Firmicutes bacterium]|jgi:formylglycine-generating enzyme|nr:hypothetical protein [Bacillota bacterium]